MTYRGPDNRHHHPLSPIQRELLNRAQAERIDADEWNRNHPFSTQKDPTAHSPTPMEIRRQQEAMRRRRTTADDFDESGHPQSSGKVGNGKKHRIRVLPNGIREVL